MSSHKVLLARVVERAAAPPQPPKDGVAPPPPRPGGAFVAGTNEDRQLLVSFALHCSDRARCPLVFFLPSKSLK